MDDKEVRIDSGLGTSIHNDCNKRLPNGNATYTSRDKSYPDSFHPLGKTDSRPCAIIGPDRVLPSAESNDVYMKTIPPEPWEYPDNYRHPYDSIKMSEYHQTHNISPRQTFQENMQRVMVPPTYSTIKSSDETSLKNPKLNVPTEGKYCDVPYSINMLSSEPKSVRSDSAMPAMNHSYVQGVQPHGWTGGVQPLKPYQAHDYYHNTEYSNCPAPRPMPIVQPQRIVHDEIHPMYTDRLYQESNIRFKPYPTSKEKFPQPRYDYSNTFQPPQNPIPKFDIQKSMHGHPYPMYPQGPYKYTVDRRYPEPMMETHPRALYPQHNAFRTHPVHPSYGPLPGNFYHNKPYPCPSDNPKSMHGNKLSYDANNKIYLELENPRYKGYPSPDNFYYNDRAKLMRGNILIPGHTQMNSIGQQHLYKKDNLSIKSIDHSPHYPYRDHRSIGNPLARMPLQFSPNTVSMSPCDSNTSNEAVMLGIPQEDCGYVSQSSTTSIRSMDSNNGHADFYRRHGFNYASTNQNAFRKENNSKPLSSTDSKKGLNLSQFFQMWNEGDEEDTAASNNNNDQINSNYVLPKPPANNNQEQLYILGSITVPQEELSKYEHLQKVSKLPENIKGYNNIEILNQFEQLVESPGMNNLQFKIPPLKEYKVIPQTYTTNQIKDGTQRPVSPLDVEAKISQSVIHKEVGCNFEIKPCSPKVLNVDVAAPVHDVLGERFIEKVANPVMLNLGKDAENKIEIVDKSMNVTSCKMANGKYNQNNVNSAVVKPLYPLQDINANMGVCLASLPQLDSDIDLNLPEVNQQFIDANKIEMTSRSPHQSVPVLENDHPDNSYARNNNFSQIHNEGPGPMADQEITKLSKYRKTKRTDTVNNPILSSSSLEHQSQRTDSVIIKNPENVRLYQESQNESLEVVKNIVHKTTQENNTEIVKSDASSGNNEMAIDFSVNRKEDAKTVNTKSEIGIANANLSKESQFCPSNMNLSVKENRKAKKSKKSSDSKSIANYYGQQDKSFTNYDHNSDSNCTSEEKSITNNKTHEEFIASKELSKMEFEDYQSETSSLTHRELNEPLKEQKLHEEHKTEEIKEERCLFTDNLILNRCDDVNKLPDLSFELTTDFNQQLTRTPLNSDQSKDYSKLENIPDADFKHNTNDVEITKLDETSNYSANKHAREVDTSKLVDTIEKELQQMDAKSDTIIDSFSEMNHPVIIEANSNVLLQENLSKTTTSLNVSVIKSSDLSCNIENKEFSNIQESTEINENVSESHNKDILESSLLTCNDKDKLISESPISENNLNCTKKFLLDSQLNTKNEDEIVISENYNTNLNKKLEINTSDNINSGDSIVEMNEIDRNFKDCKSPVTETTCDQPMQELNTENNCNQKPQAIENDNNKRDIACALQSMQELNTENNCNQKQLAIENDNNKRDIAGALQSNCDDKQSTGYEKLNSAYYKQRVHRKALFSPWVQNLILYNTDNKILCSDKNKAEANILDHQVRLDENINFAGISNSKIHEEELNYTIENVEANKTDCASLSETVDVVQAIHEYKNDISENLDNFEEKRELDEKIHCNTSCADLKQTHPVRCLSPLTFSNNNTKLLKRTSKRSLSDSALISGFQEDESLSTKRSKRNERGVLQLPSIETNLTNILRRNSISEIYNDGNVVILIDKDLILTEESQDTNICFAEEEEITDKYDSDREIIDAIAENLPQYEKELWVDDDDVACTETVFSDDVAEDVVIGTPSSPKGYISSNYESVNKESFMLCEEVIKNMENDVDMDELKISHNSTYSNNLPYDYHDSTVDDIFTCLESPKDSESFAEDKMESNRRKAENILNHFETSTALFPKILPLDNIMQDDKENVDVLDRLTQETESDIMIHTNTLNVQQNSGCEDYEDYSCTLSTSNYSSSPEVTSTTCEDKSPGIVLKISNHKRSKSSQLDNSKPAVTSNISYKLTEKKKYKPNVNSSGTLITKAAQKYIPPIKITISDLKVKLPLPKNSLDKLKQLKTSKVEPKKDKKPTKTYSLSAPRESKKPKQKFEDVLMSIDKFQYNYSKVKNKKAKDQIPKVVIKKNETGSHYTSSSRSSSDDTQSPDLTGRKWQPWVFIEKNTFIDKMALKHKVKAIYCRRKKSYILSENFRKYKSVYNAKFVISQPKSNDSNKGNLKYTIRLKHH